MNDERVLPHNLAAEKAVLGAILVQVEALEPAAAIVEAGDFFRRAHQTLFSAMQFLVDEKRVTPDPLTLRAELDRRGELEECGGVAYITALTDGLPRSTNVRHYAELVKEQATLRRLIKLGQSLVDDGYDGERPVDDIVDGADKAIIALQRGAGPGRLTDLSESLGGLYEDLERRSSSRGELLGIDTGFPSINELTFGWQVGELTVVAARPSIGKTAFVLNTALAAARAGQTVAIYSLEMRRRQLEYRLLSALSGVDLTRILGGYLGELDYPRLTDAMTELAGLPLCIDDRGRQTVWDIRAGARQLRAERGLGLLVIDYVQLMTGSLDRRGATRSEEIGDISRRLKVLADELECHILLLSQLNRAGEARQEKRPLLSDLRESGALEQDADNVAFLHRANHRESGTTQFIMEKQRNGPTGTLNLTILRETQRFEDGGDDPPPPASRKGRKGKGKGSEDETAPLPYDPDRAPELTDG